VDILERRHWAAILFLMGPSNALWLKEKLWKQDGGAFSTLALIAASLVNPGL